MTTCQGEITLEQMCVMEGFAVKNLWEPLPGNMHYSNFKSGEDISNFTRELSFPTF